jgi:hypothetical protein
MRVMSAARPNLLPQQCPQLITFIDSETHPAGKGTMYGKDIGGFGVPQVVVGE